MKVPSTQQIVEDLFSRNKITMAEFVQKWELNEHSAEKTQVYTKISLIKGEGDKILQIAGRMAKAVMASNLVRTALDVAIKSPELEISEEMRPLVFDLITSEDNEFVDELNKLVLKALKDDN